jgi:hypothetical protein
MQIRFVVYVPRASDFLAPGMALLFDVLSEWSVALIVEWIATLLDIGGSIAFLNLCKLLKALRCNSHCRFKSQPWAAPAIDARQWTRRKVALQSNNKNQGEWMVRLYVGYGIAFAAFYVVPEPWFGVDDVPQQGRRGYRRLRRVATRSLARLRLLLKLRPVLKLIFVHFVVELRNALLEPLLHISHGLVVDGGAYFLEKETKKRTGRYIADRFFHIAVEISLNGSDRIGASFFSEFDCHGDVSLFAKRSGHSANEVSRQSIRRSPEPLS